MTYKICYTIKYNQPTNQPNFFVISSIIFHCPFLGFYV